MLEGGPPGKKNFRARQPPSSVKVNATETGKLMKIRTILTGLAIAAAATAAVAADYQVTRTLQLSQSTAEVWRVIGDFCDIDDWHPGVDDCKLKTIDGRLHRVLKTGDGGEFVEQRIAAEPTLSYTYRIARSPLPLESYTATLSVEPKNGALVTWSARFSSDDPAMEGTIAALIETGLSGVEKAFR